MKIETLNINILNIKSKYFLYILLFILFLAFYQQSFAASVSLSPDRSNVTVGNIFSEKIIIGTDGKSINNAEGTIQFPVDLLEVVSINKGSSIFSLWVEEPSFSNFTGKITFNGGVTNPGFIGENGLVATITFKAKKTGSASIFFSDSAIRQNDGLGTDILKTKNGSEINISQKTQKVDVPNVTTVSTTDSLVETKKVVPITSTIPDLPVVISDTHPNQDLWYSAKTSNFNWKIPDGVISIQTSLTKSSTSIPNLKYDSSVTQKTLSNIMDGKYYFNIRFLNNLGYSKIAHYRVQIDSTPPKEFKPFVIESGIKSIVELNAEDITSGIDYYRIKIDNQYSVDVKKESLNDGKFELPLQNQGEHALSISAYDKAGNFTESNLSYTSPRISPPKLLIENKEVKTGDSLKIQAETQYPNLNVEVFVQINGEKVDSYTNKASEYGTVDFVIDPIKTNGFVEIWAQIAPNETIKGQKTEKIKIVVRKLSLSEMFFKIKSSIINMSPLISLVIILIFTIYFIYVKISVTKKNTYQVSDSAKDDVHDIINLFKQELFKDNLFNDSSSKVDLDRLLERLDEKKLDRNTLILLTSVIKYLRKEASLTKNFQDKSQSEISNINFKN